MSDKNAEEELQKVKDFVEEVKNLVGSGSNYSTMRINKERHNNGVTIENNPDLHNCVRARVYLKPDQYNTHIDKAKLRQRAEEIGAIATGQRATSLTETRQARESSRKKHYENYPGPVNVIEIGGTDNRGYPIFEIEYTVPVF